MADITGAAVRALALSAYSKIVRRQQPAGAAISNHAAMDAVSSGTQVVCGTG